MHSLPALALFHVQAVGAGGANSTPELPEGGGMLQPHCCVRASKEATLCI